MSESEEGPEIGDEQETTPEPKLVRRSFNPMTTWIYMCAAIAIIYASGWIGGYPLMIVVTLFLLIWLFSEGYLLLKTLTLSFARKATYINVFHALAWFILFLINTYWFTQYSVYLILPEIDNLTMLAPLFVCTGVFGITNIKNMYKP